MIMNTQERPDRTTVEDLDVSKRATEELTVKGEAGRAREDGWMDEI